MRNSIAKFGCLVFAIPLDFPAFALCGHGDQNDVLYDRETLSLNKHYVLER